MNLYPLLRLGNVGIQLRGKQSSFSITNPTNQVGRGKLYCSLLQPSSQLRLFHSYIVCFEEKLTHV